MHDNDLQSYLLSFDPPQSDTLTIDDLGWTREKAAEMRGALSAFAEDWDDPEMDVYDHA